MKNLSRVLFVLVFCFYGGYLNAAKVTTTPPVIHITQVNGVAVDYTLNPENYTGYEEAYNAANEKTVDQMLKYSNQKDLANGFANANAYASRAATHQAFQDYDIFAVTAGAMVGVQAPSFDQAYYTGDGIKDDVEEDGDVYAGTGVGIAFANIGVNSDFIYPGLYLNVVFGTLDLEPKDFITARSTLFGIGANYSWMKTKTLGFKLIKWRGISFGTGFYYNNTDIDLEIEMESIESEYTQDISGENVPVNIIMVPSFEMGLDVSTYTIPLDVSTSVQLLWVLNLNLGLGIDFCFGSSDIKLKSIGEVTAEIDRPDVEYTVTPGTITIDGSTKGGEPSFANPRITTGFGINILPVKIDVPIAIYLDSGASIGVTAGIVW